MAKSLVANDRPKHAMVIDDDDAVLLIATRWLRNEGYEVSAANCFEQGLSAIRTNCPDILIVDVRLGGFNGLHLAIIARELRTDARIILISGWDDAVLRAEAEACGASYLCKPMTRTDLLTQVATNLKPKARAAGARAARKIGKRHSPAHGGRAVGAKRTAASSGMR